MGLFLLPAKAGKMALKFRPNPAPAVDYRQEITAEIKQSRDISAFLLIYGYIESYMREWVLISGVKPRMRDNFDKKVADNLDRITFPVLSLLHLSLGNIDLPNYNELMQLNKFRNIIAHRLIAIDIADEKTQREIKRKTETGIKMCDLISNSYKIEIEEKARRLP